MTPIRRGTAQRLGLVLPVARRVPTGQDFADAMAAMERDITTAMRTAFLFPPMMGRPGDVR